MLQSLIRARRGFSRALREPRGGFDRSDYSRYPESEYGNAMSTVKSSLLELLVERSYLYRPEEPFVLASGKTSPVYIDCRTTTTYAPAMPWVGQLVLERVLRVAGEARVDAVGGLTMGADPIAAATAFQSAIAGTPVSCFSIRKQPKQHGTTRWIEGSVTPGDRVVVVDDVVTTGGSTVTAIERCKEYGLIVLGAVVLVDRSEEGGRACIEAALAPDGGCFASIFERADLDRVGQK